MATKNRDERHDKGFRNKGPAERARQLQDDEDDEAMRDAVRGGRRGEKTEETDPGIVPHGWDSVGEMD